MFYSTVILSIVSHINSSRDIAFYSCYNGPYQTWKFLCLINNCSFIVVKILKFVKSVVITNRIFPIKCNLGSIVLNYNFEALRIANLILIFFLNLGCSQLYLIRKHLFSLWNLRGNFGDPRRSTVHFHMPFQE